jgi:hypothetical protein
VDCGGSSSCPRCAAGQGCTAGSDCVSGNCLGSVCAVNHLVISEVRSRGASGAADEFVELYNPTSSAVTLDSTWTLTGRADNGANYTSRWAGSASKSIPSHGHFLIAGTSYTQSPTKDDSLSTGITDAASLLLKQGSTVIDAICYCFDTTTCGHFTASGNTFVCEGAPVTNPHDNSTGTNSDKSLERKPGSSAGNGQDTDQSTADFATLSPAKPQDAASTITP